MEASSSPSTLNPLAEPFRSARPPTSNPPLATDPAHEQLFHTLSTYPFHQDAEFQSGLSSILGHPETPTSPEEVEQNADLVLKAQCFYFSRQNNLPSPIDPTSYKSWLRLRDQQPSAETPSSISDTDSTPSQLPPPPPPPTQSTTPLPSDPPPPEPKYPTTFAHIVDLITRNQPVPGIETIPNIVLGTELSAPSTVPARKKPWETATAAAQPEEAPPEGQETSASASEKPLFGGLLGPLKKGMGDPSDLTPVPVEATTPSWQELAEEGAAGQVAQGGDAPVAHAT